MGLPRYNTEHYSVETGETTSELWQTQRQVAALFRKMGKGDDLVIHRTDEDAEEGALYLL